METQVKLQMRVQQAGASPCGSLRLRRF